MQLIIHRGTHEIGGSCLEIRTVATRIILDIGVPLPPANLIQKRKKPGMEDLPKVPGLYGSDGEKVDALLISHAHPDHCGLLPHVRPDIPVYASLGTQILMDIAAYLRWDAYDAKRITVMKPWHSIMTGDFKITPWLMDHSAPDALAFLIEGEGKKIFYSGDFRGHGRKSILFQKILERPPKDIDALIMEGTLVGSERTEKTRRESDMETELCRILKAKQELTFFACSSQNLDRLVSAYRACVRTGCVFVIDPYTAYVLDRMRELSKNLPQYDWGKNIRVFFAPGSITRRLAEDKTLFKYRSAKISFDEILAGKKQMLIKDSFGMHNYFARKNALTGATLIYSLWEGYLDGDRNFWQSRGAKIILLHTSGHATVKELKRFEKALEPNMVIPIHTQHPEKFSALLGRQTICLKDGEALNLN